MAEVLELDELLNFGIERLPVIPEVVERDRVDAGGVRAVGAGPGGSGEDQAGLHQAADAGVQADEFSSSHRYGSRQFFGESERVPKVDLASFWSHNPTLWFAQAEGVFELQRENCSRRKFFHVLKALDQVVLRQVADLVECVPVNCPYEILKARLLSAAKKTDFQKAEMVMALPPLGDRKPSALLAEMLELCPRGWEHDRWFSHMFLSRLPQHVRVLLRGQQTVDLRLLAEQADEIAAMFVPGAAPGAPLNNVFQAGCQQEELLAAVGTSKPQQREGQQQRKQSQQHANTSGQGNKPPEQKGRQQKKSWLLESEQCKAAREAAGLCRAHWRFGTAAYKGTCKKPCVLSEN
jgi:hypothetical protein